MSDAGDERLVAAYHEAGHAVIAMCLGGNVDGDGLAIDGVQFCRATAAAALIDDDAERYSSRTIVHLAADGFAVEPALMIVSTPRPPEAATSSGRGARRRPPLPPSRATRVRLAN